MAHLERLMTVIEKKLHRLDEIERTLNREIENDMKDMSILVGIKDRKLLMCKMRTIRKNLRRITMLKVKLNTQMRKGLDMISFENQQRLIRCLGISRIVRIPVYSTSSSSIHSSSIPYNISSSSHPGSSHSSSLPSSSMQSSSSVHSSYGSSSSIRSSSVPDSSSSVSSSSIRSSSVPDSSSSVSSSSIRSSSVPDSSSSIRSSSVPESSSSIRSSSVPESSYSSLPPPESSYESFYTSSYDIPKCPPKKIIIPPPHEKCPKETTFDRYKHKYHEKCPKPTIFDEYKKTPKCEEKKDPEITILKKEKCPTTKEEYDNASYGLKKRCPSIKDDFKKESEFTKKDDEFKKETYSSVKDEFKREKKKLN